MPFGDAEQVFHIGPASIAVPGMLQGLFAAWERFGRMSLPELVAPGVELARTGVVIGPRSAFLFRILGEMLCFTPDAAAVYAPDGSVLGEGEVFRNPALAETLEELGRTGAASMGPGGWLAERIVEGVAAAGGLVTADRHRRVPRDRTASPGGPLPRPDGVHQSAAVVGRGPDRRGALAPGRPSRGRGCRRALPQSGARWGVRQQPAHGGVRPATARGGRRRAHRLG